MSNAQNEMEIGLSAWIIQDGNYGDFVSGQISQFALEFCPITVSTASAREKSLKSLGAGKYEVVGEVIYRSKEVWVLDFGLRVFDRVKPTQGIALGEFVAVELQLGIDPFFYFEGLHELPGMQPMIYSWKINSILRQTAPFIETKDASGWNVSLRDERKLGYITILKTDAWGDDKGNAEYILKCTKLDVPPAFKITPEC
jgi:hypothetical protein